MDNVSSGLLKIANLFSGKGSALQGSLMPQLECLDIEELRWAPEENGRGDGSITKAPRGNTLTNPSGSSPSL